MTTNTLKPFNLAETLAGKPVVNRQHMPVTNLTLLANLPPNGYQRLVGVVNGGTQLFWENSGRYYYHESSTSSCDLFMAAPPVTYWLWKERNINHYGKYDTSSLFTSKEKALEYSIRYKDHHELISVEVME